ncbi:type II secretion system F family protein [Streptomyces sp. NPDC059009]|uniref:type II secretion system F family protein n=1 Tax=Streptomyces sp. NPDC059009 TaxID=3346694 RepID=UPI00368B4FCE
MNAYTLLSALCGLGLAAGLLLVVRGWHGGLTGPTAPSSARDNRWRRARREHARRWLMGSGTAGLLVGLFTGWAVGGLLAAMATWCLPGLLGMGTLERQHVSRIEGVAGWSEMLRDTLSAAAGLEQAVMATARAAPKAIRPQIQALAARLERGERLTPALRRLAGDLDDPTADLVVVALILASQHQARHLAPLLGELATTARTQVALRQRIDAARARTRTTVRVVVTTTLSFAGGLMLLNPDFLSPYDSLTGQLVLLLIGALFTCAFAWLRRLARVEGPERFLRCDEDPGARGPAAAVRQEVSP